MVLSAPFPSMNNSYEESLRLRTRSRRCEPGNNVGILCWRRIILSRFGLDSVRARVSGLGPAYYDCYFCLNKVRSLLFVLFVFVLFSFVLFCFICFCFVLFCFLFCFVFFLFCFVLFVFFTRDRKKIYAFRNCRRELKRFSLVQIFTCGNFITVSYLNVSAGKFC